jgi:hypothetical protein
MVLTIAIASLINSLIGMMRPHHRYADHETIRSNDGTFRWQPGLCVV